MLPFRPSPSMILLLAMSLLCAVSCATVTRGTTQALTVTSEPEGATITATNGLSGVTPATFTVSRKSGFTVHFEKDGYAPVDVPVAAQIHGAGGAALAGNIIAGGIIGAIVDSSTGATNDLTPNPVHAVLVKLSAEALPPAVIESTIRDLEIIGEAARVFFRTNGRWPTTVWELDLAEWRKANPGILDPWGVGYRFEVDAAAGVFVVVSAGADRTFDEASWSEPVTSDNLRADAVVRGDAESVAVKRRWADGATVKTW
jgi:hypothetical protein